MNGVVTFQDERPQNSAAAAESVALLDSLPYVETVHEDYEEYALALIEEEMKAIAPRSMKKMAPLNFRTPTMQKEYETLVNTDGDTPVVVSRPKEHLRAFQPTKIVKPTTIEEWKDSSGGAISQIISRFEAERIRSMVLEAEKEEGVANWKDYNAGLDELAAFWTKSLKQQAEAVEEINFRRQQAQTQQVGPEIDRLNQDYQQALYRRNQIEHAVEGLRRESTTASTISTRKRKVDGSNA